VIVLSLERLTGIDPVARVAYAEAGALAPAPPADEPDPADPPDALPQAASVEIAMAAAAATALR
jgi:hypothetical protein